MTRLMLNYGWMVRLRPSRDRLKGRHYSQPWTNILFPAKCVNGPLLRMSNRLTD